MNFWNSASETPWNRFANRFPLIVCNLPGDGFALWLALHWENRSPKGPTIPRPWTIKSGSGCDFRFDAAIMHGSSMGHYEASEIEGCKTRSDHCGSTRALWPVVLKWNRLLDDALRFQNPFFFSSKFRFLV
jgi:hypothetical protein